MKKRILFIIILISLFTIFTYTFVSAPKNETNGKLYESIIIIGDSRMNLIKKKVDYSKKIPKNVSFIAESGMEINWFNKTAIKELTDKLYIKQKNVAVIINMGVNDIDFYNNIKGTVNSYKEGYTMLSTLFPDTDFYILSINPINEKIINNYIKSNTRTNEMIKTTNGMFEKYIKNTKKDNLKYCDSYNKLDFDTRDGLHYTKETNEKIIDYIINDCIK